MDKHHLLIQLMPFLLLSLCCSKDKLQNPWNLLVPFKVGRNRKHIVINMLFKIHSLVTCLQAVTALGHSFLKRKLFSCFFYALSDISTNLLKI